MRKNLKILIFAFLLIIFIIIFLKNYSIILKNQQLIVETKKIINYALSEETIKIVKEPENIEVKENELATFKVEAIGTNLRYMWMRSKDGGKTWEKAFYEGYLTSEMKVTMKDWVFDYLFYCEITDKDGNIVKTEIVKANRPPVKIIKEPENLEVKENEVATFKVEAIGTNLRYMWMRSKDGGATWEKAFYEGYLTSEMKVTMKDWVFDYLFYCEITDKDGNVVKTEIVKANRPPVKIIKEPENIEVKENEVATFKVEAIGTNLRYMWMRSKDGGATWEKAFYEGYLTSEMKVTMKDWVFDYLFYCEITDKDGNVVKTEIVKANRPPVKIIKEPENIEVKENEVATFKVEAIGTNLRYMWMRSKDGGSTWEKAFYEGYLTSEMKVTMKDWVFDYLFYCEITDKDGNIVNTEIVKADKIENGLFLSNKESHIYDEKEDGILIVSRNEIINNAIINEYELKYIFNNVNTIKTSDLLILRFTAVANKSNAHIEININQNEYIGKFPINTEVTEYYLSVSNLNTLTNLNMTFETEKQRIDIYDIEILNYKEIPVQNLKTGMYNIEKKDTTVFYEKDAIINKPATDLINDDEYLYTISNGTLNIYAYDKNGRLFIIGKLDGLGNTRKMAFSDDKKYLIINSRENGTYFVDITNKDNPINVSHYTTLEFATGLYVYENYVFICSRYHGLEIIDITDINNPKFVSQVYKYNEEYYDCSVYNGYLYVSAWAQMKVEIYSLENISKPEHVSTILIDGEVGDIIVRNDILYVATGYHSRNSYKYNYSPGYGMGNGMEIYDVSNPKSPIWLSTSKIDGRYRNSDFDHWKIKVDGKYVYFTNIYNGIYIYDVTDLKAPKRIGHIYIYIDKTSDNYKKINQGTFILPYDSVEHSQGAVSGITLMNGKLYFSDLKTGIYVFDKIEDIGKELENNSTYNITPAEKINEEIVIDGYEIKKYQNNYSIFAVDENENYIYVASGDGGIVILDKDLKKINSVRTNGAVRDVAIKGDFLLSAESENGLSIYKIKDRNLEFISNYNTNKYNTCFSQIEISINSNYVMIQAGLNKLIVLDISDITSPKLIIEKTTGSMYYGNLMATDGNNKALWYYDNNGIYCYTENENGDLEVLYEYKKNIISELNGFCNINNKIIIIKDNGYITLDKSSLNDNISNNKTIKLSTGEYLRGKPIVNNSTMVITDVFTKEISIIDISDIEKPKLKTRFNVYGSPDIALVKENYIIIPLRNGGLIKLIKK